MRPDTSMVSTWLLIDGVRSCQVLTIDVSGRVRNRITVFIII